MHTPNRDPRSSPPVPGDRVLGDTAQDRGSGTLRGEDPSRDPAVRTVQRRMCSSQRAGEVLWNLSRMHGRGGGGVDLNLTLTDWGQRPPRRPGFSISLERPHSQHPRQWRGLCVSSGQFHVLLRGHARPACRTGPTPPRKSTFSRPTLNV